MKTIGKFVLVSVLLAIAGSAPAQIVEEEHRAHQLAATDCQTPAASTDAASAAAAPAFASPTIDMPALDAQLRAMQGIHAKWMAAKSAKEQQALLPEQLRVMREGMQRLAEMSPAMPAGATCARPMGNEHMYMHMQLMHAMLQLMLDRLAEAPARD